MRSLSLALSRIDRGGPLLRDGLQLGAGVRDRASRSCAGQARSVSPWPFETRRRPLAPPMCCMSYSVGVGGPQGSWALWALTFYNPNSVYHYESDDTWRDRLPAATVSTAGADRPQRLRGAQPQAPSEHDGADSVSALRAPPPSRTTHGRSRTSAHRWETTVVL